MKAKLQPHISIRRGALARLLGVDKDTVINREKKGIYPEPRRTPTGHRTYNLQEIMNLQLITHGYVDTAPLAEYLFECGYTDVKEVAQILDRALKERVDVRPGQPK